MGSKFEMSSTLAIIYWKTAWVNDTERAGQTFGEWRNKNFHKNNNNNFTNIDFNVVRFLSSISANATPTTVALQATAGGSDCFCDLHNKEKEERRREALHCHADYGVSFRLRLTFRDKDIYANTVNYWDRFAPSHYCSLVPFRSCIPEAGLRRGEDIYVAPCTPQNLIWAQLYSLSPSFYITDAYNPSARFLIDLLTILLPCNVWIVISLCSTTVFPLFSFAPLFVCSPHDCSPALWCSSWTSLRWLATRNHYERTQTLL